MEAETTDKLRDRKNRMFDGMPLDSDEEYLFLCWCTEAEELGLIGKPFRSPSFPLSDRASYKLKAPTARNPDRTSDVFLMHPHSYQADFVFTVSSVTDRHGNEIPELDLLCSKNTGKLHAVRYDGLSDDCLLCFTDVKGGFAGNRSRNTSDITFPVNQKWVYSRYGVFVNKVVIAPKKGLFSMYWAPEEAFRTVKGNPSKVYRACARFSDAEKLLKKIRKER